MGLLRRGKDKQSSRERSELRSHLRDLGELREEKLRELGTIAAEMRGADGVDRERLWAKAAEAAAIEDEAELVHRGLKEKLTVEQLEELAQAGESDTGGSSEAPAAS
jgi:hypothetical protein